MRSRQTASEVCQWAAYVVDGQTFGVSCWAQLPFCWHGEYDALPLAGGTFFLLLGMGARGRDFCATRWDIVEHR